MQRILSRLDRIERSLPAEVVPEDARSKMALRHMKGEDLMVLRRLILSQRSGRETDLTEEETRALEAYRTALAKS